MVSFRVLGPPMNVRMPVNVAPGIDKSSNSLARLLDPLFLYRHRHGLPDSFCHGLISRLLAPATNMDLKAVREMVETETQASICCQR